MSITKPYTFQPNTKARANEVNANFDTLYSQANTNISNIEANARDINELNDTKAELNGDSTQRFAVADPVNDTDAINKQTMLGQLSPTIDYIGGLTISKDSKSPNDTIIVSSGSCYDSTKKVVLSLANSTSKKNATQAASTTYYVHIVGNATGSSTDIIISPDSIDPTLPSGYTLYRLIGYYTTNGNGNIQDIFWNSERTDKYISEVYKNGDSWFRLYSDGWCEQGGALYGGGDYNRTVTFLREYKDTSYVILKNSGGAGSGGVAERWMGFWDLTKTSATTGYINHSERWFACGYVR